MSPSSFLLHVGALGAMSYGYLSLHTAVPWIETQYGGHSQYLTIQGLGLAWATMALSASCDIFPSKSYRRLLKRSLLLIALPLSVVVTTVYWSLLAFAPSLLLQADPVASEPSSSAQELFRIALSTDLALHAVPSLALLLEFFLFEPKYTGWSAVLGAPSAAICFAVWYVSWVEHCASMNGNFPYPFLNHPKHIRYPIYAAVTSLALGMFWFLNALHARARPHRGKEANKQL